MKRFSFTTALILLAALALSPAVFADSFHKKDVQLKYVMFMDPVRVLVREYRERPTPYPDPYGTYRRDEFYYYICSGAQIKNNTKKQIGGTLICEFENKWGKTIKTVREPFTLTPGKKARLIFKSGLEAKNYSNALKKDLVLTEPEQRAFAQFTLNPDMGKYNSVSAQVGITATEIKCSFKAEVGGKIYDLKAE